MTSNAQASQGSEVSIIAAMIRLVITRGVMSGNLVDGEVGHCLQQAVWRGKLHFAIRNRHGDLH